MSLPKAGDLVAGRYRVGRELGAGGMGAVFEAEQVNLTRPVALKVLYAEHHHEAALKRFEREAKVASALHHPGAVEIYDYGTDGDVTYIAMERLRGTTLRELVDVDKPLLAVPRALDVVDQIAAVLVAAHEIGLVHRDLKPENIFLEQGDEGRDRVVVVDFGLAFIPEREDTRRVTREGTILGTPDYLSPEQVTAGDIGAPSDIYSLGVVLFEMLSGTSLFNGNEVQLLTSHLFATPDRLLTRVPDRALPQALDQLVAEMLAKAPGSRPTALSVRSRLGEIIGSLGSRERTRDASHLLGRRARMIHTVPPSAGLGTRTPPEIDGTRVAVMGEMPGDLAIGLASAGFVAWVVNESQPLDGAQAIFAPGASIEQLHELRALDVPLLTDVESGDVARLSELAPLVDEIVVRPVRPHNLGSKLRRAIRKAKRGQR